MSSPSSCAEPTDRGPAPADPYRRVAAEVRAHVEDNARLLRTLPRQGRLFFDRPLPFLALHRTPPGREDAGTADLLTSLASYCLVSGKSSEARGLGELLTAWSDATARRLGDVLLLEVWSPHVLPDEPAPSADGSGTAASGRTASEPTVTVHAPRGTPDALVDAVAESLRAMRIASPRGGDLGVPDRLASVEVVRSDEPSPPDLLPLEPTDSTGRLRRLGLEISPFYRTGDHGVAFPRVVNAVGAALAGALQDALFAWTLDCTELDAPHPRALARTSIGRSARFVDQRLAEVYGSFDLLLQVTPVNAEEAWTRFRDDGCRTEPDFRYRPLPFDPESLKRRLFDVPIEKVNDPLLAHLFREKQEEMDRQISLLRDVGTDDFVHSSRLLYGPVEDDLVELARAILDRLPASSAGGAEDRERVTAEPFLEAARAEIRRYQAADPGFHAHAHIRDDITSGLVVLKDTLCVSDRLSVPRRRVEALLHHEVGTHLVTYRNGNAQPFKLLASGLAGYDPLQEGLAVLAEYVVGGLTPARTRTLAARVLAVRSMLDGEPFHVTWTALVEDDGFRPRSAFNLVMRVYRGGGFVKDALYLKGLRDLLAYLGREDASLQPLLVGKIALEHREAIQELVLREVLDPPATRPRWLDDERARERLDTCRPCGVMDLVEEVAA